jgi:hypothetical protein
MAICRRPASTFRRSANCCIAARPAPCCAAAGGARRRAGAAADYDAGPPTLDGGEAWHAACSAVRRAAASRRARSAGWKWQGQGDGPAFPDAADLLGHYEQDPIAGAEALIDRELLDGDLSQRYNLGLYAGPRGTATVVLRVPNEQERRRGSLTGAPCHRSWRLRRQPQCRDLTEAVRAGVLRYLLQVIDVLGKDERELPLATLLLGYNSSANLSVAASVEALLRGVIEANARFHETTRLDIAGSRLDIVELYQDTAITAATRCANARAARRTDPALRRGAGLSAGTEQGEGCGGACSTAAIRVTGRG